MMFPAILSMTGLTHAMHSNFSLAPATLAKGGILDWFHKAWFRTDAATANGVSTDNIGMWLWWFCTLWFVFLMALMVVFVVRYRRRKGRIAPKSPSHNTPLEIAWTVIPTLFLVYIFFRGFWSYMEKLVAPGNAVEMSVLASKWNWSLTYPNGSESNATTVIGSRVIPVFYMPAERAIRVKMNSQDVMHAFFVPDFRVKADILPNRYTTVWFKALQPSSGKIHPRTQVDADSAHASATANGLTYGGPNYIKELEGVPYEDHWLFCAEYCGDEHSEMAAIIRVVPEDAYNRWLETIGTGSLSPKDLGKRMYETKGCITCHTIDGAPNTGPTWKNMFGHGVTFTDGSAYSEAQMSDPTFFQNYARESILVPQAKIVTGFGSQMSSYQGVLNDKMIDGVIAYIMSLSDKAPAAEAPEPAAPTGQPASPQVPAPTPAPASAPPSSAPH